MENFKLGNFHSKSNFLLSNFKSIFYFFINHSLWAENVKIKWQLKLVSQRKFLLEIKISLSFKLQTLCNNKIRIHLWQNLLLTMYLFDSRFLYLSAAWGNPWKVHTGPSRFHGAQVENLYIREYLLFIRSLHALRFNRNEEWLKYLMNHFEKFVKDGVLYYSY